MLKDRLQAVFDALGVSYSKVSQYVGFSRSNITRLVKGDRVPPMGSKTTTRLANGMVEYAKHEGRLAALMNLLGVDGAPSDAELSKTLLEWLYTDGEPTTVADELTPYYEYSKRFDAVMRLIGISNIRFAKLTGIDPSYISRFRTGGATPRSNHALSEQITQSLLEQAYETNKLGELAELAGIPLGDADDADIAYSMFRSWLLNLAYDSDKAVERVLANLSSVPPALAEPERAQIKIPDLQPEAKPSYQGVKGLRAAVTRFLCNVVKNHDSELLLYSDEPMDWMMEAEFSGLWKNLMLAAAKNGTKIKILHDIGRDTTEMMEGVIRWLPLYMTGMVDSHYSKNHGGDRFTHTCFVGDNAAITGFGAAGMEAFRVYEYATEKRKVGDAKEMMNGLFADSEPLLSMTLVRNHDALADLSADSDMNLENIGISIRKYSVTVTHLVPPYFSFTTSHPLLCATLAKYVENRK